MCGNSARIQLKDYFKTKENKMKLPIGHRLTLSGYEVEVVGSETVLAIFACSQCPRFCERFTFKCTELIGEECVFKLIKDLRPDRGE
jgi:hypothetical protein